MVAAILALAAAAVILAVSLVIVGAFVARLCRDLDEALRERDEARAEITRCHQQHLGDLDALVEATRPAGPPPLDAVVRPIGIFPTNPPYHHRGNRP